MANRKVPKGTGGGRRKEGQRPEMAARARFRMKQGEDPTPAIFRAAGSKFGPKRFQSVKKTAEGFKKFIRSGRFQDVPDDVVKVMREIPSKPGKFMKDTIVLSTKKRRITPVIGKSVKK